MPGMNLQVSSIIFLDAPVGTGFSYSTIAEGYHTGDKVYACQSRIFLEKVKKPQYFYHIQKLILGIIKWWRGNVWDLG